MLEITVPCGVGSGVGVPAVPAPLLPEVPLVVPPVALVPVPPLVPEVPLVVPPLVPLVPAPPLVPLVPSVLVVPLVPEVPPVPEAPSLPELPPVPPVAEVPSVVEVPLVSVVPEVPPVVAEISVVPGAPTMEGDEEVCGLKVPLAPPPQPARKTGTARTVVIAHARRRIFRQVKCRISEAASRRKKHSRSLRTAPDCLSR